MEFTAAPPPRRCRAPPAACRSQQRSRPGSGRRTARWLRPACVKWRRMLDRPGSKPEFRGVEARPGDACLEGAAGCAAMPLADCALLAQKSQPLPGPGCCTNKDVFRSCPNLGAGRGARIGFEAVSIDRATPRPKNDTAVPAASSWCPDHFLPTLTRPGRPADVPAVPVPSTRQPRWACERFAGIDQDLEKG
jgi:hypothetical protein